MAVSFTVILDFSNFARYVALLMRALSKLQNSLLYFIFQQAFAFTLQNVSKSGVLFGSHLPVFGLNTETSVNYRKLSYSVRILENADQEKLRIWTLFSQSLLRSERNFKVLNTAPLRLFLSQRFISFLLKKKLKSINIH